MWAETRTLQPCVDAAHELATCFSARHVGMWLCDASLQYSISPICVICRCRCTMPLVHEMTSTTAHRQQHLQPC